MAEAITSLLTVVSVTIIAVSFVASAITAAFGIGGGLLLIGVMSVLLPPAAVVPVHGVIMLGSNAGRTGILLPHVSWPIMIWFAAGAALGGFIGAQIVFDLQPTVLRLLIAGFILFTQWGPQFALPASRSCYSLAGGLSMFLTLFVGASGPFITAILSRMPDISRLALIATAGACMTAQHGGKTLIFGFGGFSFGPWGPLIAASIIAGFFGTLLGTRILKHLNEKIFRRALKWALTILAGWLVVLALAGV